MCIDSLMPVARSYDQSKFSLIIYQCTFTIIVDVMRKIYTGASFVTLLVESIRTNTTGYIADNITNDWVESLVTLLEETSIEDLLDNGFISTIPIDSETYPGLWPKLESSKEDDVSND